MKKWSMGDYLRLSADELKAENDESNSVSNQRKLINYYLDDKKDIKIYKSYVDDGYTGTDFNRPGYKAMIKDIESGKINGVIVKDLSRLGRNYIEVGNFLDEIIPRYNLRFISINDNVDSYVNPNFMDSLEIPLKNLMNEGYSKDSSKKMRSSLAASKKAGNFIGKVAPYGYLKDDEDCHKLVVDPDAANVVKRIFNLVIKGKSKQEIIDILNENHIPTPSIYLKEKHHINVSSIRENWTINMLDSILKNENYIGSIVQGKRTRISHKVHNIIRVAEEDWIRNKQHHESIIKEEVFYHVQDVLYNRNVRVNNSGTYNKYSGFIKCPECGNNLYRFTRKKRNKEKVFYYCGTYIRTKKCNKHYILESELDEIVLTTLNNYIDLICEIRKKIEDTVSFSRIEYNSEVKKIRLVEIDKEIEKYQELQNELVSDYKCNYISKEDFEDFNIEYLYEINKLNIEKEELCKSKLTSNNMDWLNKYKKNEKFDKITRCIVDEFIENIFVYDDRSVEITFKYKDQYEDAIMYLKSRDIVI